LLLSRPSQRAISSPTLPVVLDPPPLPCRPSQSARTQGQDPKAAQAARGTRGSRVTARGEGECKKMHDEQGGGGCCLPAANQARPQSRAPRMVRKWVRPMRMKRSRPPRHEGVKMGRKQEGRASRPAPLHFAQPCWMSPPFATSPREREKGVENDGTSACFFSRRDLMTMVPSSLFFLLCCLLFVFVYTHVLIDLLQCCTSCHFLASLAEQASPVPKSYAIHSSSSSSSPPRSFSTYANIRRLFRAALLSNAFPSCPSFPPSPWSCVEISTSSPLARPVMKWVHPTPPPPPPPPPPFPPPTFRVTSGTKYVCRPGVA